MGNEIILTIPPKLGDGLFSLPVGSWLARERDCKIHWVLGGSFNPFNFLTPLLMLQPMTSRVTVVPFEYQNFDCGGQPYRFDPAEFGIEGEFYNFGFRSYPTKFVSAFFAEEHDFDYDRGYRLNIGLGCIDGRLVWPADNSLAEFAYGETCNQILRSTESAMSRLVPHAEPMGTHEDLLTLARRMAAAKECHVWMCGLGILAAMSGIPVTVHRVPGHASIPLYYEPEQYQGPGAYVTFCEHQEDEVR